MMMHLTDDSATKDSKILVASLVQQEASVVLHAVAACFCCDFTLDDSGIPNAGPKTVVPALKTFLDKPGTFSVESFADALLNVDGKNVTMARNDNVQYVQSVVDCFVSGACYHDAEHDVRTIGGQVVESGTDLLRKHARGLVNLRDKSDFTEEAQTALSKLDTHTFIHRSWISKKDHDAYALPPGQNSIESCTVPKLKNMIAARGGNTVSDRGEKLLKKDLVRIMKGYYSLEEHCSRLVPLYD